MATYNYADANTDPMGMTYQGGATGVQNDYNLRQMLAQLAAQSMSQGMNLPTSDQIQTAKGDLSGALGGYKNLMDNGMYSNDQMNSILSNRVQQVNNTTQAMQQNLNASNASRGVYGNAGQSAALDMAGQFQAAGQRGQANSDLQSEQAQSKLAGLQGYTGVSGTLAGLDTQATRQDPNSSQYTDLYNQWRNAPIGPDGANFISAGTAGGTPSGSKQSFTVNPGGAGSPAVSSGPVTPYNTSGTVGPTKKKALPFNYAY